MSEKFDVIVVGAGPSGNAAAYTAAKAGLSVLQIERGEYPGSKNVQGAILYANALEQIIPDFREDAPLERHIIEQRMWVLDEQSFVGTHFRSDDYNKPPYNRYTIIRAQFDKWFSSKVKEAGALVICETTVDSLLMDGDQVVGVRCDRQGGEVFADVVILADGVNSTLARKAGFHGEIEAKNVALAVKEILFMPQETIEARFNVKDEEGVVIEMFGKITDGLMGTGFLYTNRDSITLGVGCMLSDFKENPNRTAPYAMLEKMKAHPSIAPLIAGGEMKEYCAHLIPEGGFYAVPKVVGNGWMIVGDSGGFVNATPPGRLQPGHDHRPPRRRNGDRRQGCRQGLQRQGAGQLQGSARRILRDEGSAQIPGHAQCVPRQQPVLHHLPRTGQPRRPDHADGGRHRQENQGEGNLLEFP